MTIKQIASFERGGGMRDGIGVFPAACEAKVGTSQRAPILSL
jgi:hypothetical protein